MKNVYVQMLAFASMLALAGCSDHPQVPVAGADVEPAAVEPAGPAPAQAGDDGLTYASDQELVEASINQLLGDPAAFRSVFNQLKAGVAAGDRAAVAALVDYPLEVTIDGHARRIADATEFVASWDSVITPDIERVVAEQQFEKVFVNWQGVSLGDGQVWINGVCENDACADPPIRVTAIQAGPR